jgi:hypothetical protein
MKPQSYTLHAGNAYRELVLQNALAFLERLPQTKSWQIEVREYHKPRSSKQRRALFGVAYKAIMAAMGLSGEKEKNELHAYFCADYFGSHKDSFGRARPNRTTTTNERGEHEEIDVSEALKMYAHIQRRAAEVGIDVPDPDPALASEGNDHAPQRREG